MFSFAIKRSAYSTRMKAAPWLTGFLFEFNFEFEASNATLAHFDETHT
jgi:hypothetical protein